MPMSAMLANPFVLATMTIIAIGVIAYQILQNEKKVPTRGRSYYRGIDYRPDKPDEYPGNFDNGKGKPCNETKSEKSSDASSGVRKRAVATQNADSHGKGKPCNEIKSEKSSDASSLVRKQTVATQTADSHSHPVSNSVDENSNLASGCSINRETQYPSQQNSEMQKGENNISQGNSNNTFVANIKDEDSDSSESNNLQVQSEKPFEANIDNGDSDSDSSESNNSLQNHSKSLDLNKSICSAASTSSTSRSKNIRTPSPIDSFEEIYKRDVCNHLKTDIEGENSKKEKCFKNFSDEESDASDNNSSSISEESNASCTIGKKPELCKGCLEEIANAVAYPCNHCYLCLDCAVKVHRIFKKCTICYSVIKTFEQLKM